MYTVTVDHLAKQVSQPNGGLWHVFYFSILRRGTAVVLPLLGSLDAGICSTLQPHELGLKVTV